MEKDTTLVWQPRTNSAGRYYVSDDDRWRILSPSLSTSRRFELHDTSNWKWHGDWPTLREAKERAQQLARSS